jgi:hypothetical protein
MPREPVVDFLGHIGLVYVMFLAGLEIDLDVAREHAAEALEFGALAFFASLTPAVLVAFLVLDFDLRAALLLALAGASRPVRESRRRDPTPATLSVRTAPRPPAVRAARTRRTGAARARHGYRR